MGGMSIGSQPIDFGSALTEMRLGNKVSREVWRDSGVFVVLQAGYPDGIEINGNTSQATGIPQGTRCAFKPYLMKRTEDGSFMPWTPDQADVLATDWFVSTWKTAQPESLDYREAASLILKRGFRLSRSAWANNEVYVYFLPETGEAYKRHADNWRAAYTPSEADRKATDWFVTSYFPEGKDGS